MYFYLCPIFSTIVEQNVEIVEKNNLNNCLEYPFIEFSHIYEFKYL